MPERLLGWMERHWRLVVVLAWLLSCALFTWQKWGGIVGFQLGDTDDTEATEVAIKLADGQA